MRNYKVSDKKLREAQNNNSGNHSKNIAGFGRSGAPSIARILKKLGEHEPSALFNAKMTFCLKFPRISLTLLSRLQTARRADEKIYDKARQTGKIIPLPNRTSVYAAVAVLVVLSVFVVLYAVGLNTGPGNSLYFVRKIRDRFDLTLSKNTLERLNKEIALADENLNRIGELATPSESEADTGKVKAAVDEYRANVKAVNSILSEKQLPASPDKESALVEKLKSVKVKEAKVLSAVISRNPESVLAPGEGATVSLKEIPAEDSAEEQDLYRATVSKSGEVILPVDKLKIQKEAKNLDLIVAGERRRLALPLPLDVASQKEEVAKQDLDNTFIKDFTIECGPPIVAMRKGEKSTFTLTLKKGGEPVPFHKVLIEDANSSSLLNGGLKCLVTTDTEGKASFILTKTDPGRSSRISFNVQGKLTVGAWVNLGERFGVGGIEGPSSSPLGGEVTAKAYGNSGDLQFVELENKHVKLRASSRTPGVIIESIQRKNGGHSFGPMRDPLTPRLNGGSLGVPVRNVNGPYLVFAEKDLAGYEISYEIPLEEGWLKRRFRVILTSDGELALIFSRVEKADGSLASSEHAGVELDIPGISERAGKTITFSGNKFDARSGKVNLPWCAPFSISEPYALIENDYSYGVLAIPYTLAPFVRKWVVTENGVSVELDESAPLNHNAWGFAVACGFAEKTKPEKNSREQFLRMSDPIYFHVVSKTLDSEFLVNIDSPKSGDEPKEEGSVIIKVYKTYESLSEKG